MCEQLISLLTLTTIALASYGLGRPITRGLRLPCEDLFANAVWSVTTGLIVAGLIVTFMGMTGLLYAPAIGVLTLAAGFWGVGEIVAGYMRRCEQACSGRGLESALPSGAAPASSRPAVPRWLGRGVALLAIVACVGSLLGALAPPTAGDAMCYHLALPKTFLTEGSFCFLPYHDRSTFPLLAEIWFLWAMAVDSPTAATLVHWALGLLMASATVLLAREIVGRSWAWIAGCVVLLVPGVNNQMSAPLNDVALAAMTTLALAAWWKGLSMDQPRCWFVLAGLAAGAAVSTKYIAALFALAMAATVGWECCRPFIMRRVGRHTASPCESQRRRLLVGAAIVASICLCVSVVWYARAAWHRGNPVYPFLAELQSDPGAAAGLETLPATKSPLGRSPWALATAAWHLTMHPENLGGRGHQLGALWLAAAPGLLFARRLRGLGRLLGIIALYAIAWFLLRQNQRFLFPIVPLMAVALVWVWIEARRLVGLPRLIFIASQAIVLLASAGVACSRHSDRLAVAVGLESRGEYLSRSEPTHGLAQYANATLKPGDRILSQDYREFYFDVPVVWEKVYRRITQYDKEAEAAQDFGRFMRRRGFTHLLLAENASRQGMQFDPTLGRLADADATIRRLIGTRFTDADGGRRLYRLVELPHATSEKSVSRH